MRPLLLVVATAWATEWNATLCDRRPMYWVHIHNEGRPQSDARRVSAAGAALDALLVDDAPPSKHVPRCARAAPNRAR